MTTCFAFDLDGTVTSQELLPLIAGAVDLEKEMRLLTEITLKGLIPFEDSFRLRCAVLANAPIGVVRDIVASVKFDPDIEAFIKENRSNCAVVTGNLDVWIKPLVDRLGCECFCSQGVAQGDRLSGVANVLRKSKPILELRERFSKIVVIGESVNDMPMFDVADIGIAFGGVHEPVREVIEMSHYVVFEGRSLCRLLSTL